MPEIEQAVVHVDGVRTFYRRVRGDGPPTVYVHGNPTHSADWVPFLERIDGPALALDLPGWGFSERPSRDRFDYTMDGLGRFFAAFLERLGVTEHALVVHDWGVVGLIAAQRRPEQLRRLVIFNAVPLLPGYRWHPVARYLWRRRGIGELANLTVNRLALRVLLREAIARPGPPPEELIEIVIAAKPPGTWPAVLELYRSADPERLATAGRRLDALGCPALVVWGTRDPYIPPSFGRAYAERLPDAELVELDDAGHWPWIERPDAVETVAGFLGRDPRRGSN